MAFESFEKLGAFHLDALAEIGNIGSGNAATALATLINTTVHIDVPSTRLIQFSEIADFLGGNGNVALSMSVMLEGDLNGMMLHVLNKEFAHKLINTFYEKPLSEMDNLTEMDISVIREMSNITCAAYVNSLASLTGMFINISPPSDSVDTIYNILNKPTQAFKNLGDHAIFIDEVMRISNTEINSRMILVLELNSLQKLFDRLNIKY